MSRAQRAEALRVQAIGPSPVLPATTFPDTIRKSDAGGTGVKPAPFAYAKAKSLDHAIELLARPDGEARLLAGGQSLIATLNMRLSAPKLLIDLNGIGGLAGIAVKNGTVEIGALTRHAEAERSAEIARHAPLIALAMPHIGHAAIRNRGTLGGSIAFADPAAELPACLLALGGEVEIAGPKGKRTVKADDFFKGLFETALGPGRRADRDPRSRRDQGDARGLCRVRPPPRRLRDGRPRRQRAGRRQGPGRRAARLFRRRQRRRCAPRKPRPALTEGNIDDAVKALAADLDPTDDVQATGATKKHLAGVLLRRVARQLMEARP